MAPTKSKLNVTKKELNGVVLGYLKTIEIAEALGISKERIYIYRLPCHITLGKQRQKYPKNVCI